MARRPDLPGRAAAGVLMGSVLLLGLVLPASSAAGELDGFNLVATPGHPFGSDGAARSLARAKRVGAKSAAIVSFLWQATPADPRIAAGNDVPDEALRAAIRQVRAAKLTAMVKPQVWVPHTWAGAVEPKTDEDWRTWFARYRAEIERIGRIAAEEGADAFSIGTELEKTTHRPEWLELIEAARAVFPRRLLYVAHNLEEAEAVPFWPALDAIGVTLYPPLGPDEDRTGRRTIMAGIADRLADIGRRFGKPVVVGEIGIRSAKHAAAKPWESAEERRAEPDPQLQADVIADWLAALDRPGIEGVLVWRWFTDPVAGGPEDTDFTVQGKAAERVLACAWARECGSP